MQQHIINSVIVSIVCLLHLDDIIWQTVNAYSIDRGGYENLFGNYTGGGDGKEEPKYRVVGASLQGKYYNGLIKLELHGQEDFPQYHVKTSVHYFLQSLISSNNSKQSYNAEEPLLVWEVVEVKRIWPLSGVITHHDCFAAKRFEPDRKNSKTYNNIQKIGEEYHRSNWMFPIFIPVQRTFNNIQAATVGAIRLVHYNGKWKNLECFEYEEWKSVTFSYWTCRTPPTEQNIMAEHISTLRIRIATLLNVHILKIVPEEPCKCFNCQHIVGRPWHYKITLTGNEDDINNLQSRMQKEEKTYNRQCENQEQDSISQFRLK
ncbi:hypothetical protein Ddc_13281 [Ditylenchus destructor]|nr:hypothetical protein Ddc_13281 [Ditylenchus destructor]